MSRGSDSAIRDSIPSVARDKVPPARPSRLAFVLAGTGVVIVAVGAWYLTHGQPELSLGEVWRALIHPSLADDDVGAFVVRELRLPRLLLALAAGAALGLAGTIMQDALRNPIADPGLLGVSQAAALVVAITLLFPGTLPAIGTPFLALIAGLITGAILVVLARSIRDPVKLILIGFMLAMFYATLTSVVVLLVPSEGASYLSQYFRFEIGSVSGASWERLDGVWPWFVIAAPLALLCARTLNLLALGDDLATGLGMRVTRARLAVLFVAVMLVAPVVATVGPISFVALLSPHVSRFVLGTSNAFAVLPASAAIGALVVLLADTAGRLLFFPLEIPAGIWTIVVVGPAAIWLAGSRLRPSTGTENAA